MVEIQSDLLKFRVHFWNREREWVTRFALWILKFRVKFWYPERVSQAVCPIARIFRYFDILEGRTLCNQWVAWTKGLAHITATHAPMLWSGHSSNAVATYSRMIKLSGCRFFVLHFQLWPHSNAVRPYSKFQKIRQTVTTSDWLISDATRTRYRLPISSNGRSFLFLSLFLVDRIGPIFRRYGRRW